MLDNKLQNLKIKRTFTQINPIMTVNDYSINMKNDNHKINIINQVSKSFLNDIYYRGFKNI
jgi:hypothetical protein